MGDKKREEENIAHGKQEWLASRGVGEGARKRRTRKENRTEKERKRERKRGERERKARGMITRIFECRDDAQR